MNTVPVVRFTVAGLEASRGLGRPYTCVYDGTCKVCTRLANALRKWDHNEQVEVVPSQAPGVMARFPWIPPRAYAEALQLVGPNGHTWQKVGSFRGSSRSRSFERSPIAFTAGSRATDIGLAAASIVSPGRSTSHSAIVEH